MKEHSNIVTPSGFKYITVHYLKPMNFNFGHQFFFVLLDHDAQKFHDYMHLIRMYTLLIWNIFKYLYFFF